MAAHPNLQVKVVLLKEGVEDGPKEIRRFRLGEEESGGERSWGVKVGLLHSLLTRVHSAFNVDSQKQRCTLFWKDQDGDLVQFSTEEELTHALSVNHDDTFRLYITLSAGDPEDKRGEKEAESERHVSFEVHIPDGDQGLSQDQPSDHCTDPAELSRLDCPGQPKASKGQGWGPGNKKAWKAARKAGKKMMDPAQNKEFNQVRQQVPEEFRCWVRQFVRLWTNQGPDAALKAFAAPTPTSTPADKKKKLPTGISADFPQWLHAFLSRYHAPYLSSLGDQTTEMMEMEGEMPGDGERLEGLPPVYFRWICLFLPRFRAKFGLARAILADSEGEETRGVQGEGEGQKKKGQGKGHGKGQGKHHGHGGRKENKRGGGALFAASSESEESDGGKKKALKINVPKEFRQFARQTVIQLHKKKANNSENKKKATQAGLSSETQEFTEQILIEFHGKLTNRRPRAVSMEMIAEERALPVGIAPEHFMWLCRFLLRWHRRHAGKCDVMSGWSSGETTTTTDDDDTCASGGEDEMHGHGHHHHHYHHHRRALRAAMRKAKHMPHGMMGMGHFPHPHHPHHPPPPPPFAHAMNSAGGPPPPPPPAFFGCPLPAGCYGPPHSFPQRGNKRWGNMWAGGPWAAWQNGNGFDKCWKEPKKEGAVANAADGVQGEEMPKVTDVDDAAVGCITESMKKM